MTLSQKALGQALSSSKPVFLSGGPGAGKSTAANEIVAAAESQGKRALLVSPPAGAADAGVLALANVTRHLGGGAATRAGWSALRVRARKLLSEHRSELVLVIDEPSNWKAAGGIFERRAQEASETLFGISARWPVVVCDQPSGSNALALPQAAPHDLMADTWGELASAARALHELPIALQLQTPLAQRLAVAIVGWGGSPRHADVHRLAEQLAASLDGRRHGPKLWALWQRLALARTPLEPEMLRTLGGERLSKLAVDTLNMTLLDGAGRLHDVLRTVPEDRPPDPELATGQRRDAHEMLFEHHFQQFEELARADAPGAADHAAEALFHAGELDDEARIQLVGVDLVEELNALGHRLGTVRGDHHAAITAYVRVLQADPDDAHALHFLAFHRDALGMQPREVDIGYTRAVKLDPGQPTWHARRVAFMVDTGRPAEARRAWAEAESALAEDRGDRDLYAELHAPVAASLLAAGELAFCSYVLDGVPRYARNAQHRSLVQLLTGRIAGQDGGAFVPAPRSGRTWWQEGPERLPARDTDGRALIAWLAGRVEAVDDFGVDLHVVQVTADGDLGRSGLTRLSFDALTERLMDSLEPRSLVAGRFIEIGRYRREGVEDRTGIAVLTPGPISLPVDILPSSRWQSGLAYGPADS